MGIKKNRIFTRISKMFTYLCLTKRTQNSFFGQNIFWAHFVTEVTFLKSAYKFGSFYTHADYLQTKKSVPIYSTVVDFLLLLIKNALEIDKRKFNKLILDFSSGSKST
jgi:hypothetical protein